MGVMKSTDGGETWREINIGLSSHPLINDLAIDPTMPTTLFAGTYEGMFISTDSGENWYELNTGMIHSRFGVWQSTRYHQPISMLRLKLDRSKARMAVKVGEKLTRAYKYLWVRLSNRPAHYHYALYEHNECEHKERNRVKEHGWW